MNKYIKTIEVTEEQIKRLEEFGFIIRWLAHLDDTKEIVEVYVKRRLKYV